MLGRCQRSRTALRARAAAGFTAIEIMLVVAIIGITAVVAFPSYASYRERAKVAQAVSDIKTMDVKLQHYRVDNYAYPPTLTGISMAGKLDPWGNPYQYVNLEATKGHGKARKDKNLVPINSDFDLYSMGKDGASVGPLTALASDFDP